MFVSELSINRRSMFIAMVHHNTITTESLLLDLRSNIPCRIKKALLRIIDLLIKKENISPFISECIRLANIEFNNGIFNKKVYDQINSLVFYILARCDSYTHLLLVNTILMKPNKNSNEIIRKVKEKEIMDFFVKNMDEINIFPYVFKVSRDLFTDNNCKEILLKNINNIDSETSKYLQSIYYISFIDQPLLTLKEVIINLEISLRLFKSVRIYEHTNKAVVGLLRMLLMKRYKEDSILFKTPFGEHEDIIEDKGEDLETIKDSIFCTTEEELKDRIEEEKVESSLNSEQIKFIEKGITELNLDHETNRINQDDSTTDIDYRIPLTLIQNVSRILEQRKKTNELLQPVKSQVPKPPLNLSYSEKLHNVLLELSATADPIIIFFTVKILHHLSLVEQKHINALTLFLDNEESISYPILKLLKDIIFDHKQITANKSIIIHNSYFSIHSNDSLRTIKLKLDLLLHRYNEYSKKEIENYKKKDPFLVLEYLLKYNNGGLLKRCLEYSLIKDKDRAYQILFKHENTTDDKMNNIIKEIINKKEYRYHSKNTSKTTSTIQNIVILANMANYLPDTTHFSIDEKLYLYLSLYKRRVIEKQVVIDFLNEINNEYTEKTKIILEFINNNPREIIESIDEEKNGIAMFDKPIPLENEQYKRLIKDDIIFDRINQKYFTYKNYNCTAKTLLNLRINESFIWMDSPQTINSHKQLLSIENNYIKANIIIKENKLYLERREVKKPCIIKIDMIKTNPGSGPEPDYKELRHKEYPNTFYYDDLIEDTPKILEDPNNSIEYKNVEKNNFIFLCQMNMSIIKNLMKVYVNDSVHVLSLVPKYFTIPYETTLNEYDNNFYSLEEYVIVPDKDIDYFTVDKGKISFRMDDTVFYGKIVSKQIILKSRSREMLQIAGNVLN